MKKIAILVAAISLAGCATKQFVQVTPLDRAIVEAATLAKKAGANTLTVEVSAVNGVTGTAGGTIKVVELSAEVSREIGTTVSAEVDLKTWNPPSEKDLTPYQVLEMDKKSKELFIKDSKTMKLQPLM